MENNKPLHDFSWLEKFFNSRIDALEKLYDQRFLDQEKAVLSALNAAQKAVEAALVANERAKDVDKANVDKWRENANEWRDAMDDRERNFLPRNMGYVIGGLTIFSFLVTIFEKFTK